MIAIYLRKAVSYDSFKGRAADSEHELALEGYASEVVNLCAAMREYDPTERPTLEQVNADLLKLNCCFATDKKILIDFCKQQMHLLNEKLEKGGFAAKGAKEKHTHYSKIHETLSREDLSDSRLFSLINALAIVGHHRRRRTGNRWATTFSLGATLLTNHTYEAASWRAWKSLKFHSSYFQSAHEKSLDDKQRRVKISDESCDNYKKYRVLVSYKHELQQAEQKTERPAP